MWRVAPLSHDDLASVYAGDLLRYQAQMFLRNQVYAEIERRAGEPSGTFWGVFGPDGLATIGFFGESRVLVVGPGDPAAARALIEPALGSERGFRILIGPRVPAVALLDELRAHVRVDLDRSQPFLVVDDPSRLGPGAEARAATAGDTDWLARASLQLNEEDLGIPASTVDRKLLKRRIGERLRRHSTWVVDAGGRPVAKLEVGNEGPAGALIEGVWTEPAHRRRGLARRLVAGISKELLGRLPAVGLHVGRDNKPAITAYLAAGFREVEDLQIALIGWR